VSHGERSVRLDADLADGIDKFIADRDQPPTPRMSRLDALNVIVRYWLTGQGYIPLPPPKDEAD
jgi:hypothetical protein